MVGGVTAADVELWVVQEGRVSGRERRGVRWSSCIRTRRARVYDSMAGICTVSGVLKRLISVVNSLHDEMTYKKWIS